MTAGRQLTSPFSAAACHALQLCPVLVGGLLSIPSIAGMICLSEVCTATGAHARTGKGTGIGTEADTATGGGSGRDRYERQSSPGKSCWPALHTASGIAARESVLASSVCSTLSLCEPKSASESHPRHHWCLRCRWEVCREIWQRRKRWTGRRPGEGQMQMAMLMVLRQR